MDILNVTQKQWKEVRKIYMEAFPRPEQKPFFTIKRSVKKGKAQLMKDRTSFVIAHRLSTIHDADMILYMEDTALYNSQFA